MAGAAGPISEPRRADRAALLIAVALFALAAVLFWDSSRLGGVASYARIGPQIAPQVLALCLAGLGAWTVIAALRRDFPEREPQEFRPEFWIIAGLLGQLVLLRITGFSIATGALSGLVAYALGRKPSWLGIPVATGFALIVWLIFSRGLSLNLPTGPLEDAGTVAVENLLELRRAGWDAIAAFIGGVL